MIKQQFNSALLPSFNFFFYITSGFPDPMITNKLMSSDKFVFKTQQGVC